MTDEHPSADRDVLLLAHDRLTTLLTALSDADHHLPTPCMPWTVAEVVDHVAGGAVMAAALLGGAAAAEALTIRNAWSQDRLALERVSVALAVERAAFGVVDPSRVIDHPVVPMTAAALLGQRIIEYAVHTWDVRQAIGDRSPSDPVLARRAWQLAAPLAPYAAGLGMFGAGPSGRLPDDADDEARLLDVTGRRVGIDADRIGTVAS